MINNISFDGDTRDKRLKRISYNELVNGEIQYTNDDNKILAGYLTKSVVRALLSNPNYSDPTKSVMNLIVYDGVIAGRTMMMQTKIKAENKYFISQSGGGIEISKKYRGNGLGKIIIQDTWENSEYPLCIGQLYSSGAIAIIRKLGITVFEKPLYVKMLRTRSLLISKGVTGINFKIRELIGDLYLKVKELPNKKELRKLKRKYQLKKEINVPLWTEQMTLFDGHKYSEVHDRNWLQWNLDNHFTENPDDSNSFYGVYDMSGSPCGFFMTKVRHEENNEGFFKNLFRGTIVEWGSFDENVLTEVDLNLLAVSTFSAEVDKINTVISTIGVDDEIKKMHFEYRGMFQMSIKADIAVDDDIYDQEKWRIRYGGANTILV